MKGIVGFRCDKCGHKITETFESFDEHTVMMSWIKAREKFEMHVHGPREQEEMDKERAGDDCNG